MAFGHGHVGRERQGKHVPALQQRAPALVEAVAQLAGRRICEGPLAQRDAFHTTTRSVRAAQFSSRTRASDRRSCCRTPTPIAAGSDCSAARIAICELTPPKAV